MTESDDETEVGEIEVPDEQANVLPLFKKAIDKSPFPLTHADGVRSKCRHEKTEYDLQDRTIECRACGKPVDPFTLLVRICREWDSIVATQRAAQNEIDRLNQQIDERTKARAKVSRAREARAATTQIDKALLDDWLSDNEKQGDEAFAKLGRWMVAQLRTSDGNRPMLLIEVVDKKEKP